MERDDSDQILIRFYNERFSFQSKPKISVKMFPFVPTNHHIRPPTTNNSSITTVNSAERNFWSVWTGGSECTENKSNKKLYQKVINKSNQRIVSDAIKPSASATVGCYASECIPKDTKTKTIGAIDSYSTGEKLRKFYLSIRGGYLQASDKTPEHAWIKKIKLSTDTHSNNVILEMMNNELCVRTTRNINANEEVMLWFDEEILAAMYIPFLTPANILGKISIILYLCE